MPALPSGRLLVVAAACTALVVAGTGATALTGGPDAAPAPRTPAAEPVSTGDRAVFVPVSPVRLLDTKKAGGAIAATTARTVQITGATVPADAVAVVVNLGVVSATKAGFLTAYPYGTARPAARTLHFGAAQVTENLATVRLGSGGRISVYNGAPVAAHAVADVAGYYRAHAHDDRYLLKAEAQGRTAANAMSCAGGTVLQSIAADGAATCVTDAGTTFTPGAGLLLDNGVLAAQQSRSAANAFTCPLGQYLRAVAADGAPTCAPDVDTDTDTTYSAGHGLLLEGDVFSAEQGRSAKNAFTCAEGSYLREVAADGEPVCAEDAVGPEYQAGFGLLLTNGVFSAQQGRSAPNAFACPPTQYLQQVAADGAPLCASDANTTYGAGSGLALTGTTFSLAEGTSVVRVKGDSTDAAANGTRLRTAMTGLPFVATVARPIVVVLSPGTYDLGAAELVVPENVTLAGSGRGATVVKGAYGAGSAGLLGLRDGSVLTSLTVTNTAATGAAVAPVVAQGGTSRIYDVAATATSTAAASTAYGFVVFSGGTALVERSTFTASGPGGVYGLYAVASVLRGTDVEASATSGTGAAYGAAAAAGSTIELAGGGLKAATTSTGTAYGAAETGASDQVRLAHARLTGGVLGTPACVGTYDEAFAPRAC